MIYSLSINVQALARNHVIQIEFTNRLLTKFLGLFLSPLSISVVANSKFLNKSGKIANICFCKGRFETGYDCVYT